MNRKKIHSKPKKIATGLNLEDIKAKPLDKLTKKEFIFLEMATGLNKEEAEHNYPLHIKGVKGERSLSQTIFYTDDKPTRDGKLRFTRELKELREKERKERKSKSY